MNGKNRLIFKKNYSLVLFIIILFLSFVLINIGSGLFFGQRKADFTYGGKYSLSEASKQIVKEIKTPTYIRVYLSSDISSDYPSLYQYSQFVLRWLENYQNLNPEQIRIEIKNPKPYSKTAEEAAKLGLKSLLSPDGQTELYFGAAFGNDNGDSLIIPQFTPGRISYLETDISRTLAKLNMPLRSKIGIISDNLPIMNRVYGNPDSAEWSFLTLLKNSYDVVSVSSQTAQIPFDIETLIVINPKKLHPLFLYALDQYVLRGGRIILFIDPFSEVEADIYGTASVSSPNVNKLLKNWGLHFPENKVIGDNSAAMQIIDKARLRNYPLWLNLSPKNINQQNLITRGLNRIILKSPGTVEIAPDFDTAKAEALLTTSANGGSVSAEAAGYLDKTSIIQQYSNDRKIYTPAVLVEGKFDSAFTDNILAGTGFEENMLPFLPSSTDEGKILVVADTDVLNDENWVNEDLSGGEGEYDLVPFAQNGDFVLRTIDYFTGNTQALSITAKNILQNQKSIAAEIQNQSAAPFAAEYEQAKRSLTEKEKFAGYWADAVRNNSIEVSMPLIQKMEQNRQEIKELQEKLKYIEYQIRTAAAKKTDTVIWLNMAAIPFALLLIIWVITLVTAVRRRRKVQEIINEYKIS